VWQYQGIVEIERLSSQSEQEKKGTRQPPLIERLDEYSPSGRADLNNLVVYPPTLRPIPVKPLFFDVAWNYIDYPREGKKAVQTSQETKHEPAGAADDGKKEAKRGWFGFGRS
jgi:signal recognition particle subunit SRP68